MHKWILFVLIVGGGVFGIGALANSVNVHAKANAPEDTGGLPLLKITASNYQFDKPEYTVKAGTKMKVSFALKEGIHEMHIAGYEVKLDRNNPSADVTFDKPGTYEIRCVLPCGPGHPNMASKLIVQ